MRVASLFLLFIVEYINVFLKKNTRTQYISLYKRFIEKAIGNMDIESVTRKHISDIVLKEKDRPYQANRIKAICSKFFNWCIMNNYKSNETNPAKWIRPYREKSKKTHLNEFNLHTIWTVINKLEIINKICIVASNALRMLMLTGARKNEILTMKWEHVDFINQRFTVPDSKTGPKEIYLTDKTIDIVNSIPKISEFVFYGQKPASHLYDLRRQWKLVLKTACLPDHWRIHDLRHAFASVAVNSGASIPHIGAVLGHKSTATTEKYAHVSEDPAKKVLYTVEKIIIYFSIPKTQDDSNDSNNSNNSNNSKNSKNSDDSDNS
jgi:integrase